MSKGKCIIMGDFNDGHIQWTSQESRRGDDQQFLLLIYEKQGKRSRKKHLSKEAIIKRTSKFCGRFIGVPERMKTTQIKKKHLLQQQIKLNNLRDAMSKN